MNREDVLCLLNNAMEACATAITALEVVRDNFPAETEKVTRRKYNLSDVERQRRVEQGKTIGKMSRKKKSLAGD